MATKIQQILEVAPNESVLFGSWLSSQGLDARGQYAYMKSGWLDRISKGVYKIHGTEPSLFVAVSSYNTQLGKSCVVGAYTALELRGYSHYLSMGKPKAYLFTDKSNKLPLWLLKEEWD
ncbi:MAG: AbiEi antitoxin N-terminal domain-containing protein, partial [Succinivibrionaceae bacterium]|nr:AbiEi antitoxin N-terminal domain-containing protein [Succinivibrionaceae bacterium]